MSTLILKAEVQARIDALTYPIDAAELLQNAVDTVGLELDLTHIISILRQSTDAITGSTNDDDITALNAASIALGVTSKGGSDNASGLTSILSESQVGSIRVGDELINMPITDSYRSKRSLQNSTGVDSIELDSPNVVTFMTGKNERFLVSVTSRYNASHSNPYQRFVVLDTETGESTSFYRNGNTSHSGIGSFFFSQPTYVDEYTTAYTFLCNGTGHSTLVVFRMVPNDALNVSLNDMSFLANGSESSMPNTTRILGNATYSYGKNDMVKALSDGTILVVKDEDNNSSAMGLYDDTGTLIEMTTNVTYCRNYQATSCNGSEILELDSGNILITYRASAARVSLYERVGNSFVFKVGTSNLSGFQTGRGLSLHKLGDDIVATSMRSSTLRSVNLIVDEDAWTVTPDIARSQTIAQKTGDSAETEKSYGDVLVSATARGAGVYDWNTQDKSFTTRFESFTYDTGQQSVDRLSLSDKTPIVCGATSENSLPTTFGYAPVGEFIAYFGGRSDTGNLGVVTAISDLEVASTGIEPLRYISTGTSLMERYIPKDSSAEPLKFTGVNVTRLTNAGSAYYHQASNKLNATFTPQPAVVVGNIYISTSVDGVISTYNVLTKSSSRDSECIVTGNFSASVVTFVQTSSETLGVYEDKS